MAQPNNSKREPTFVALKSARLRSPDHLCRLRSCWYVLLLLISPVPFFLLAEKKILEYIEGVSVKDVFLEFRANVIAEERLDDVAAQIGEAIAKLHDGGLAHGDLTTSNMLVRSGKNQLVLIDFGPSFTSTLPEDKAVDLYVLERALLSMYYSCGNVMDRILTAYRESSKQWSGTFNKLAQVRQRGRKRTISG